MAASLSFTCTLTAPSYQIGNAILFTVTIEDTLNADAPLNPVTVTLTIIDPFNNVVLNAASMISTATTGTYLLSWDTSALQVTGGYYYFIQTTTLDSHTQRTLRETFVMVN